MLLERESPVKQRSRPTPVSKILCASRGASAAACSSSDAGRNERRLAPSPGWCEERSMGRDPFCEAANSGLLVDERFPSEEFSGLPNVADVARLITGPPIVEPD